MRKKYKVEFTPIPEDAKEIIVKVPDDLPDEILQEIIAALQGWNNKKWTIMKKSFEVDFKIITHLKALIRNLFGELSCNYDHHCWEVLDKDMEELQKKILETVDKEMEKLWLN